MNSKDFLESMRLGEWMLTPRRPTIRDYSEAVRLFPGHNEYQIIVALVLAAMTSAGRKLSTLEIHALDMQEATQFSLFAARKVGLIKIDEEDE